MPVISAKRTDWPDHARFRRMTLQFAQYPEAPHEAAGVLRDELLA